MTHEIEEVQAIEQDVDDAAVLMLARLDARNTPEMKLCAIFQTTAGELVIAREAPNYQSAYAQEVLLVEVRSADMDDGWDDIEAKALSDLREYVNLGGVADPKTMLSMAATANKMGRRADGRATDFGQRKPSIGPAVLDANPTTVIKLRTRVVTRLSKEDGHERIVEREAEIIRTSADKTDEIMTADQMHRHITTALNTDITGQVPHGRSGADTVLDDLVDLDPAMFGSAE